MREIDDLIATNLGYNVTSTSTAFLSIESHIPTDNIFIDLVSSKEDLRNICMKLDLVNNLTNQKINMLKKLKRCYCDNRMKNVNAKHSLESYLDHSTEVLGIAIGALLGFCIALITKVIKFIVNTIVWLGKTVIHGITSLIAGLTKNKKPEKKKVDNFFTKFFKHLEAKVRGLASLNRSLENEELTQMNKDILTSLAQYCNNFIIDSKTAENMQPEELFFYKIFLIDGNPKDIKYVYESFNRSTSSLKEYGAKLSRAGSRLIVDARPTANTNRAFENLYDQSIEETRAQELERLGNILIKSNIVDITKHDPIKDLKTMIQGIYNSLLNSEDILWMKKFYNTFQNGQAELKIISKDLETNKKQLEKIDKKVLSEDNKRNIELYNKDVIDFQNFIVSYNNCIQYYLKYYKIRTEIIQRFSNIIYYTQAA